MLGSFGGKVDGWSPQGQLLAANGKLYGTTVLGGKYGNGVIFSIKPSGGLRLVHQFLFEGSAPYAGLTAVQGAFYGTLSAGGEFLAGSVYKMTSSGTVSALLPFDNDEVGDGVGPQSKLAALGSVLYGTTSKGGTHGQGTIFSVTTGGTQHTLYSFTGGTDGEMPTAGMAIAGSTLFGTTSQGGANGSLCGGTLFSIGTNGSNFKVLHAFGGGTDGDCPVGQLFAWNGKLYGETNGGGTHGGGTVFVIATNGSGYRVLHNFGFKNEGHYPAAGAIVAGNVLYGTTACGGAYGNASSCGGTVFGMNLNGTGYRVLHNFGQGADGANPEAELTAFDGTLYGTTQTGGPSNSGTVFAITPNP